MPSERVNSAWSPSIASQDQALVALELVHLLERLVVAEDHLGLDEVHPRTRFLGEEAGRDPARVVAVDDELVAPFVLRASTASAGNICNAGWRKPSVTTLRRCASDLPERR